MMHPQHRDPAVCHPHVAPPRARIGAAACAACGTSIQIDGCVFCPGVGVRDHIQHETAGHPPGRVGCDSPARPTRDLPGQRSGPHHE